MHELYFVAWIETEPSQRRLHSSDYYDISWENEKAKKQRKCSSFDTMLILYVYCIVIIITE